MQQEQDHTKGGDPTQDPAFYAFKAALRRKFPSVDMIEAAEGKVTVVIGGSSTVVDLQAP